MKDLEKLNKGIAEQMDELENIKRSLKDDNNNKIIIEKKLENLEKGYNDLKDISKYLNESIERYIEENTNKLEDINKQMENFKFNITESIKETKKDVDKILENYSRN